MSEQQPNDEMDRNPQNPMTESEIEQLSQVYNGMNLFHKAQLLVFLSRDALLESPVNGSFLPMQQCEVGIRGTSIVLRLPGRANEDEQGEPENAPTSFDGTPEAGEASSAIANESASVKAVS